MFAQHCQTFSSKERNRPSSVLEIAQNWLVIVTSPTLFNLIIKIVPNISRRTLTLDPILDIFEQLLPEKQTNPALLTSFYFHGTG